MEGIFYLMTVLSISVFAIGLTISSSLSSDMGSFIRLQGKYFDFADYLIVLPFCVWAWLIIAGIFFIKKNWIVISICTVLLIPHIIIIAVSCAYSYGVSGILKMYAAILSFGMIQ